MEFVDRKTMNEQFFQVPSRIYKYLKGNDLRVYLMLLDYWNELQNYSYPTYKQMLKETGIQESRIAKHLSYLEENGYIEKRKFNDGKQYKNNTYTVFIPSLKYRDKRKVFKTTEVAEISNEPPQEPFENDLDINTLIDNLNELRGQLDILDMNSYAYKMTAREIEKVKEQIKKADSCNIDF